MHWQRRPLPTTTTIPGLDIASQAAAARPAGADRSGSADGASEAGRAEVGQATDKQRRRPLRPRLLVVKKPITSWMPLLFLNLQFALPFLMTIAFVRAASEVLEVGACVLLGTAAPCAVRHDLRDDTCYGRTLGPAR